MLKILKSINILKKKKLNIIKKLTSFPPIKTKPYKNLN